MKIEKEITEQLDLLLKLATKIEDARETARREVDKERGGFNIFRAILRTRTELEEIHSNFISYLLDPSGGHDHGPFFINSFFEFIKFKKVENKFFPKDNDFSNCFVKREYTFDGGRIDIFLENTNWLIFIENKINSSEIQYSGSSGAKGQIDSYFKYVKGRLGDKNEKNHLGIYLTKDGIRPLSIQQGKENLICLSYSDIMKWLEAIKEKLTNDMVVEKDKAISAISQYCSLLKDMLSIFQSQEEELFLKFQNKHLEMNAVEIIRNQSKIENALSEVKVYVSLYRKEFLQRLRTELSKIIKGNNPNGENVIISYGSIPPLAIDISQDYENHKAYWGVRYNDIAFPFSDKTTQNLWYRYLVINGHSDANDYSNSTAEIISAFQSGSIDAIIVSIAESIVKEIETWVIPLLNKA